MATDKELCENLRSLSVDDPDRILRPADFDRLKLNRKELFDSLISILTSEEEDLAIRKQAVNFIRSIICDFIDTGSYPIQINEFMQKLVDARVEVDDPLQECILKAFCQICCSKKEKFVPYIDGLIKSVLKDLEISELQPVSDDVKDMAIFSTADGKKIGLKESEIKKMIRAVDLLSTFIKVLGAKFGESGKHLVAAGTSLLHLLKFSFNIDMKRSILPFHIDVKDIKRSILTATVELFRPARELTASNLFAHLSLSKWIGKVVKNVLKDLTLSGGDAHKVNLDLMLAETRGLNKCLRDAGPNVLKDKLLGDLCKKVFALMGESCRRVKIADDAHHVENGVVAPESVESDSEQALRSTLREISAAVMMFHKNRYLLSSAAEWCSEFIEAHLDPSTPVDRALALFVWDDVLAHLNVDILELKGLQGCPEPRWPTFENHVIESLSDSHPGVRRAAAFGLIQAAKCPQFSYELIQTAAAQLVVLLSETQSQEKASLSATDNMIAALGAILEHRRFENGTNPNQLLPEKFVLPWINNLPLKVDDKEGRRVHGYFVGLLQHPGFYVFMSVLGPHSKNFPKLAAICASIYRTDFSTETIDKGIKDFITHFGFGVTSSVGADFDKELQKGLERIYRDLNWA